MVWHRRNQTEDVCARRVDLLKELGQLARERDALQRALGALEERFQAAKERLFLLRTGDAGDE